MHTRVCRTHRESHYSTCVKDSGNAKHQTQPEYMVREMSIVYDHLVDTAGPFLERSNVDALKGK